MEESVRCEAILELGKKLTSELDLSQSVDTLGRWMAHYIAELIDGVEKASVEERPAKMLICSEAILSLWKHRRDLPDSSRPFERIEPVLRALEILDPEGEMPRYFRSIRAAADATDDEDAAKSWLKLIDGFDYSAKLLIRYCLTQAAQSSLDKSMEWVALAESAGMDDGVEFPIIRIISHESDLLTAANPDEAEIKQLEDRICRLESFVEMTEVLASELRESVRRAKGAISE